MTFYYNRYSDPSKIPRSIKKFSIQLLICNEKWYSKHTTTKDTNYGSISTEWI